MPPPPPPPPPPPAPLLLTSAANSKPSDDKPADRNALLSQIRQGKKLKKADTNDKSVPLIKGKDVAPVKGQSTGSSNSINAIKNGPFCVGDLFSQGMPKLRSTNKAFMEGGKYKSQLNPRHVGSSISSKSGEGLGSTLKGNSYLNSASQQNTAKIKQNGFLDTPIENKNSNISNEFSEKDYKPKKPMLPLGQKPTISSLKYGQTNIDGDSLKLSGSNPELLNEVTKHNMFNKPQVPSKFSLSLSASTLPTQPNILNEDRDCSYSQHLKVDKPSVDKKEESSGTSSTSKRHMANSTSQLVQQFNANKSTNWGGSVPDLAIQRPIKSNAFKQNAPLANLSLSTSAIVPKQLQKSTIAKLEEQMLNLEPSSIVLEPTNGALSHQNEQDIPASPIKADVPNGPVHTTLPIQGNGDIVNVPLNHPKPPARHNRRERCKVKPTVAPPPVPNRPPPQLNASRALCGTQSPGLPPPPPPPRSTSQNSNMDSKYHQSSNQKPTLRSRENSRLESKLLNGSKGTGGFEDKFLNKFHVPTEFPRPGTYSRETKFYPSKSTKNRKPINRRHSRPTAVPPPPPS